MDRPNEASTRFADLNEDELREIMTSRGGSRNLQRGGYGLRISESRVDHLRRGGGVNPTFH